MEYIRSFTDGAPRVATQKEVTACWNGAKNGAKFRCYLCGHRFAVGDTWRWQYMHGKYLNFMVCEPCDGHDVAERWKAHTDEFKSDKFWALRGRS